MAIIFHKPEAVNFRTPQQFTYSHYTSRNSYFFSLFFRRQFPVRVLAASTVSSCPLNRFQHSCTEDQTNTETQDKDGERELNLRSSARKIWHPVGLRQGHYLHWHATNIADPDDSGPSSSVPTM